MKLLVYRKANCFFIIRTKQLIYSLFCQPLEVQIYSFFIKDPMNPLPHAHHQSDIFLQIFLPNQAIQPAPKRNDAWLHISEQIRTNCSRAVRNLLLEYITEKNSVDADNINFQRLRLRPVKTDVQSDYCNRLISQPQKCFICLECQVKYRQPFKYCSQCFDMKKHENHLYQIRQYVSSISICQCCYGGVGWQNECIFHKTEREKNKKKYNFSKYQIKRFTKLVMQLFDVGASLGSQKYFKNLVIYLTNLCSKSYYYSRLTLQLLKQFTKKRSQSVMLLILKLNISDNRKFTFFLNICRFLDLRYSLAKLILNHFDRIYPWLHQDMREFIFCEAILKRLLEQGNKSVHLLYKEFFKFVIRKVRHQTHPNIENQYLTYIKFCLLHHPESIESFAQIGEKQLFSNEIAQTFIDEILKSYPIRVSCAIPINLNELNFEAISNHYLIPHQEATMKVHFLFLASISTFLKPKCSQIQYFRQNLQRKNISIPKFQLLLTDMIRSIPYFLQHHFKAPENFKFNEQQTEFAKPFLTGRFELIVLLILMKSCENFDSMASLIWISVSLKEKQFGSMIRSIYEVFSSVAWLQAYFFFQRERINKRLIAKERYQAQAQQEVEKDVRQVLAQLLSSRSKIKQAEFKILRQIGILSQKNANILLEDFVYDRAIACYRYAGKQLDFIRTQVFPLIQEDNQQQRFYSQAIIKKRLNRKENFFTSFMRVDLLDSLGTSKGLRVCINNFLTFQKEKQRQMNLLQMNQFMKILSLMSSVSKNLDRQKNIALFQKTVSCNLIPSSKLAETIKQKYLSQKLAVQIAAIQKKYREAISYKGKFMKNQPIGYIQKIKRLNLFNLKQFLFNQSPIFFEPVKLPFKCEICDNRQGGEQNIQYVFVSCQKISKNVSLSKFINEEKDIASYNVLACLHFYHYRCFQAKIYDDAQKRLNCTVSACNVCSTQFHWMSIACSKLEQEETKKFIELKNMVNANLINYYREKRKLSRQNNCINQIDLWEELEKINPKFQSDSIENYTYLYQLIITQIVHEFGLGAIQIIKKEERFKYLTSAYILQKFLLDSCSYHQQIPKIKGAFEYYLEKLHLVYSSQNRQRTQYYVQILFLSLLNKKLLKEASDIRIDQKKVCSKIKLKDYQKQILKQKVICHFPQQYSPSIDFSQFLSLQTFGVSFRFPLNSQNFCSFLKQQRCGNHTQVVGEYCLLCQRKFCLQCKQQACKHNGCQIYLTLQDLMLAVKRGQYQSRTDIYENNLHIGYSQKGDNILLLRDTFSFQFELLENSIKQFFQYEGKRKKLIFDRKKTNYYQLIRQVEKNSQHNNKL